MELSKRRPWDDVVHGFWFGPGDRAHDQAVVGRLDDDLHDGSNSFVRDFLFGLARSALSAREVESWVASVDVAAGRSEPAWWFRLADAAAMALKRYLDVVIAVVALLLLLPMALGCAALVGLATEQLPIRRTFRLGKGGQPFRMYAWTEVPLDKKRASFQLVSLFVAYLYFIPPLLNVVAGRMSLVGPEPLISQDISEQTAYSDYRDAATLAKPGLYDRDLLLSPPDGLTSYTTRLFRRANRRPSGMIATLGLSLAAIVLGIIRHAHTVNHYRSILQHGADYDQRMLADLVAGGGDGDGVLRVAEPIGSSWNPGARRV